MTSFILELWPPIVLAVKQHKNHHDALKCLQVAYCTKERTTGL